jgi:multicomponent Na+:H+ antiporter subunit B
MRKLIVLISLAALWIVLLFVVAEMPPVGDPGNPTNTHVVDRYLKKGVEEAGCENIVTAIVLNYRGYDTMGEVTVIFTALCSVLAILGRERPKTSYSIVDISKVKSSVITRTVILLLLPLIIMFSLYVILHGDVSPGGGFQGGTVAAASLIVFTLVFGYLYSLKKIPVRLRVTVESSAPIAFAVVGLTALAFQRNFLTFMIPGIAPSSQLLLARALLLLLEIGIGLGGATIFTSIFYSMKREEPK